MKKVLQIIGVLTTVLIVAGVCMKAFAFPGANIALIGGVFICLLVYFALMLVHKIKESASGKERAMNFLKYVSEYLVALGMTFFIMHYPGAMLVLVTGMILMVVGYLPLHLVVMKKKNPEHPACKKVPYVIIALALIFAFGTRNMGGRIFQSLTFHDVQTQTVTASIDTLVLNQMKSFESTEASFPNFTSGMYSKAEKIGKLSDELVKYIRETRNEVIAVTEKKEIAEIDTMALYQLCRKDNTCIPTEYFIGKDSVGKATELKQKLIAFSEEAIKIMDDKDAPTFNLLAISDPFKCPMSEKEYSWEKAVFEKAMLISDVIFLDNLVLVIKQAESQYITYLHQKAKSDVMWYYFRKYQELRPKGAK
jgi:hypothetical protein